MTERSIIAIIILFVFAAIVIGVQLSGVWDCC
jgi:hypothetical protein